MFNHLEDFLFGSDSSTSQSDTGHYRVKKSDLNEYNSYVLKLVRKVTDQGAEIGRLKGQVETQEKEIEFLRSLIKSQ